MFSTPDFSNPGTRLADFWVAYAPHHMTVLSPDVLKPLWEANGFRLDDLRHEAMMMRKDYGEMSYLGQAGSGIAAQATGYVMDRLLNGAVGDQVRQHLGKDCGIGVEMVVTLCKRS